MSRSVFGVELRGGRESCYTWQLRDRAEACHVAVLQAGTGRRDAAGAVRWPRS